MLPKNYKTTITMKNARLIFGVVAAITGVLVIAPPIRADSYTITIPAGATWPIANQLNNGANTADVVLPNPGGVRDGDRLEKWNCSGYTIYMFDSTFP